MVALFGRIGLLDETIVFDKVGIPVVGLAAEEAVVAIEPFLERPLAAAGAGGNVLFRNVVVLAEPEGAEPVLLKNLADGGTLGRNPAHRAWEAVGSLGDAGAAVQVMVSSRQKR